MTRRLSSGIDVHVWRPTTPATGVVVLVHGFAEYAERYVDQHSRLVPHLVEHGFEVWAPDLWGHGTSPGRRGLLHVERAVADLEELLSTRGGLPVLLVGHSMGGLLSAALVADQVRLGRTDLDGVVLLSPAIATPVARPLRRALGMAARVFPSLPIPERRRPLSELSRRPEHVVRAQADPLMFDGQVSLLLACTALDAAAGVRASAREWSLPCLVVHGTADTYTDPGESTKLFDAIGSDDKSLHLVDGGFHELLDDLDADHVLQLVLSWLDTHRDAACVNPSSTSPQEKS